MKGQVYILLLAALVYISETILVSSRMVMVQQGSLCCALPTGVETACNHCDHATGSSHKGCPGAGHHDRSAGHHDRSTGHHDRSARNDNRGNGRSEGGSGCNNTANCANCPLCYTATLSPSYHPAKIYATERPAYPVVPGKRVMGYHPPSWKPPDTGQFA